MIRLSIVIVFALILALPLSKAFGAELNAIVFAQDDLSYGHFKSQYVAEIEYEDSKLKSALEGVDKKIEFKADMNVAGVRELRDMLNSKLVSELGSPAQFKDITINYKARIAGSHGIGSVDVALIIDFTLEKFVISGSTVSADGARVDLNWRGLAIREPVILNVPEIGEIDINSLKGFIIKADPELASMLESVNALDTFSTPLLDFSEMKKLSIDRWASSFDASGAVAEASRYGLADHVPPVLTTLAKGESSLREGEVKETVITKDISIDGEKVKLKVTIPPAYASLRFAGYATTEMIGNNEYAIVTDNPPVGKQIYQSQNLPLMVIAVFAGMAAVIAGVIIWKVNKK